VIALAVGAIPEMVEDGVTGFIVPPDDDSKLRDAIRTLLADPALRSRMGTAARARAVDRYDIDGTAVDLIAILEETRREFADRPAT
jgi:glycosyltransferase involved in cell wall biosynthesis